MKPKRGKVLRGYSYERTWLTQRSLLGQELASHLIPPTRQTASTFSSCSPSNQPLISLARIGLANR